MRRRGPRPKPKPPKRPKNRYDRQSKLAEYQFLRVLKGFADLRTPKELASETGISDKTIRETFWCLRFKIMQALQVEKTAFGGAGHYLFRFGQADRQSARLISVVADSEPFAALIELQLPGIKRPTDQQLLSLLMEMVVRFYCQMSGALRRLDEYGPDVEAAYRNVRMSLEELRRLRSDGASNLAISNAMLDVAEKTMIADLMRDHHELGVITEAYRSYVNPADKLNSDLKRFLAKYPIEPAERKLMTTRVEAFGRLNLGELGIR